MSRALVHNRHNYASSGNGQQVNLAIASEQLAELCGDLNDKGETFLKLDDLYEVEVAPGVPLYKILYETTEHLTWDQQRALQIVIDRAKTVVTETIDGIRHVGAVGIHEGFGSPYYVGNVAHWRDFLRAEIVNYVRDPEEFEKCCEHAFPILELSPRFPNCLDTFEGGFSNYVRTVVTCFSALNDLLLDTVSTSQGNALQTFSALTGFDTTLEGDASRRTRFIFPFSKDEIQFAVLCEPHMKLHCSDNPGDSHYYQHRIYFSSVVPAEFGIKVLVGHAGEHL